MENYFEYIPMACVFSPETDSVEIAENQELPIFGFVSRTIKCLNNSFQVLQVAKDIYGFMKNS